VQFLNILIISSDNTGSGHKSIGEALLEQFKKYPEVNVKIIEGYDANKVFGSTVSKSYGFLTRRARIVWKAVWNISAKRPDLISKITERSIKRYFVRLIEKEKPDLILSIHPHFNAPLLNILFKNRYNIPFITLLADLISISPLWVDPIAIKLS
jgi:processive 1,2-diacylglycerol beta-glucosyltransferase